MNIKISSISFNKKFKNILNLRKNKSLSKDIKILNNAERLSVVPIPFIACLQSKTTQNHLDKNLAKEAINKSNNRCAVNPITDRTQTNIDILKKSGLNESDAKKHIDAQGYMDKEGKDICRSQGKTGFKGSSEQDLYEHRPADLDTELSSIDSELATLDSEHARLAADSVSAQEAIESGLLDEVGVSDILDQITDHPGIAVATGVAAELLPGTRFLKPAKDFLDGDFAKAGIGAATRLGEIALGPLKLLWAGGTGLIGGVMGMFHPEDEELGFWKCFKYASMSWAKGRDNIENIFIDRETSGEKKSRLKREANEKFAEEMRKVEAKKDELKEKRQHLELQEQARRIEAQRRQEELEKQKTKSIKKPLHFFEQQRIKEKKKQSLINIRAQLKELIDEYISIYPNAPMYRFANWQQWDLPKLSKARKFLRKAIQQGNRKKKKV